MSNQGDADQSLTVDALGLVCPLPLIRLQQRLDQVADGSLLTLLADDPTTLDDIPFWCEQSGQQLVEIETLDDHYRLRIKKTHS